jgi:hypothetical protein
MHTADELIIGIVGDAELGAAQIEDREVAAIQSATEIAANKKPCQLMPAMGAAP